MSKTLSESGITTEGALEVEGEIAPCPFLEAPSRSECMSLAQKQIWDRVNQFADIVSQKVHAAFNEALDAYRYTEEDRAVGERIRRYLEEKHLTYPRLRLMFGQEAKDFLRQVEESNWYNVGEITEDQGLLIFQLPAPLARFWWKSSARLMDAQEDEEWEETGEERRWWQELLERIRRMGASTRDLEKGLLKKVIEWGDFYDKVMDAFLKVKDELLEEGFIRLVRANPYSTHDPTLYYYVWVVREDSPNDSEPDQEFELHDAEEL